MAIELNTISRDKIAAHAKVELEQSMIFFQRCPTGDSYLELQRAMNVYQNITLNAVKASPGCGMEMNYQEFVEVTKERYAKAGLDAGHTAG